jgi:hypothetical protein
VFGLSPDQFSLDVLHEALNVLRFRPMELKLNLAITHLNQPESLTVSHKAISILHLHHCSPSRKVGVSLTAAEVFNRNLRIYIEMVVAVVV